MMTLKFVGFKWANDSALPASTCEKKFEITLCRMYKYHTYVCEQSTNSREKWNKWWMKSRTWRSLSDSFSSHSLTSSHKRFFFLSLFSQSHVLQYMIMSKKDLSFDKKFFFSFFFLCFRGGSRNLKKRISQLLIHILAVTVKHGEIFVSNL